MKNNKKAFTLAELLVVVAIIAILVAIAIPTFGSATKKAEEATVKANLRAAYAEYEIQQLIQTTDSTYTTTCKVFGMTIDGYTYELKDGVMTATGSKTFGGSTYDGTTFNMAE